MRKHEGREREGETEAKNAVATLSYFWPVCCCLVLIFFLSHFFFCSIVYSCTRESASCSTETCFSSHTNVSLSLSLSLLGTLSREGFVFDFNIFAPARPSCLHISTTLIFDINHVYRVRYYLNRHGREGTDSSNTP